VTGRPSRRRLIFADDGIIDPIAVELAARGTRQVALTRTERLLAATAILARGGTPYLIATRLHVSGTTAHALAARCRSMIAFTRPDGAQRGTANATAMPLPSAQPGTGKHELRASRR
jgi:hypothetical protein